MTKKKAREIAKDIVFSVKVNMALEDKRCSDKFWESEINRITEYLSKEENK